MSTRWQVHKQDAYSALAPHHLLPSRDTSDPLSTVNRGDRLPFAGDANAVETGQTRGAGAICGVQRQTTRELRWTREGWPMGLDRLSSRAALH